MQINHVVLGEPGVIVLLPCGNRNALPEIKQKRLINSLGVLVSVSCQFHVCIVRGEGGNRKSKPFLRGKHVQTNPVAASRQGIKGPAHS